MTTEHETTRTLVKSPPELWAECSDASSLARHLGEFGEISITRLEPETTVAWEGEHASGTVRIEPAGWGTRVTLTAQTKVAEPEGIELTPPESIEAPEPEVIEGETHTDEEESDATATDALEDPDPVPTAESGPARARWRRLTAKVRGLFAAGEVEAEAVADEPPPVEPDPAPTEPEARSSESAAVPIEPEPVSADPEPAPPKAASATEPSLDAEAVLASALESLGQAHHRPFSRA